VCAMPPLCGRRAPVAPSARKPSVGAVGPGADDNGSALLWGGAGGGSAAAFIAARAVAMRGRRTAALACLALAYATIVVAAAVAAPGPAPLSDMGVLSLYSCMAAACIALMPGVRAASSLHAELAAAAAAALVLFSINVGNAAAAGGGSGAGQWGPATLMAFAALPLAAPLLLAPRASAYAIMAAAHAARACVELAPLGAVPALGVCLAAIAGAALCALQERGSWEHFVRACVRCGETCQCCARMRLRAVCRAGARRFALVRR
jgi:hypothetical protein